MANYTQASRPIAVSTPLGPDVLLITGFGGDEGLSRPFHFQVDCIAEKETEIAFDDLLGQKITVRLTLPDGKPRFFNGICQRVTQGEDDEDFTPYRLDVVPQFWLLTKRAQSRIFQHIAVPDILKNVLTGLDVDLQIMGTFQPRNYCVQYRETDFNFASRLMEEEGIYYFFTHTADGHKMVVANTPQSHPDMPWKSTLTFEKVMGGAPKDDRILAWEKAQELVSGKYTLRDHTFELPHDPLETNRPLQDAAAVGRVNHKLKKNKGVGSLFS